MALSTHAQIITGTTITGTIGTSPASAYIVPWNSNTVYRSNLDTPVNLQDMELNNGLKLSFRVVNYNGTGEVPNNISSAGTTPRAFTFGFGSPASNMLAGGENTAVAYTNINMWNDAYSDIAGNRLSGFAYRKDKDNGASYGNSINEYNSNGTLIKALGGTEDLGHWNSNAFKSGEYYKFEFLLTKTGTHLYTLTFNGYLNSGKLWDSYSLANVDLSAVDSVIIREVAFRFYDAPGTNAEIREYKVETFKLNVVPEPSTVALLGGSLVLLAFTRKFRKKS